MSTNREPEILKKSKAIPYTIHDKTIIQSPSPGSPNANSPKRNTHAIMLKSITDLIPKRRRKKGIARMNKVSDICEIDMMIAGYCTAILLLNSSTLSKSCKNVSP